ncbi:MAG TPA: hypothetical protein VNQ76_16695, partial [Planctomicrobium sp.]|nr:hypothetical protein [Planctomicrobium sp.]
KPDSFLHVKSQCLEGEVVATRNGVYSASTEIQDLRRLTKKAAELGNGNSDFIPLKCYRISIF